VDVDLRLLISAFSVDQLRLLGDYLINKISEQRDYLLILALLALNVVK